MQEPRLRRKPRYSLKEVLGISIYKPKHLIRKANKKALAVFFALALVLQVVVPVLSFAPGKAMAAGINYYVSTTGNDGNSGTESAPFRTIGKAVSVARAGDTILVRGGTYYETVTHNSSGASGSPIMIKNYPNEKPVLNGGGTRSNAIITNGQSYIRWEGFEITSYGNLPKVLDIENSHDIAFVNCEVHHISGSTGAGWPNYGAAFISNSNHITFDGCQMHDTGDFCVWGNDATYTTWRNCRFYNIRAHIITGLSGNDLIENCYFQKLKYSGGAHGIAIFYGGNNTIIRNNTFVDCARTDSNPTSVIEVGGTTNNSQIYNNLVYGIGSTQGQFYAVGGSDSNITRYTKIFNNTAINLVTPLISLTSASQNTRVYNNLYQTTNNEVNSGAPAGLVGSGSLGINYSHDYNIRVADLNAYFVNPSLQDYHLKVGSTAIDKGSNNPPDITLSSTDIDGKTRVVNGVDIGAFEFGASR